MKTVHSPSKPHQWPQSLEMVHHHLTLTVFGLADFRLHSGVQAVCIHRNTSNFSFGPPHCPAVSDMQ